MENSKLKKRIAFVCGKYSFNINALQEILAIIEEHEKRTYTANQIMNKLLEINPQIKPNSKTTNPFIYADTQEWYYELSKIK